MQGIQETLAIKDKASNVLVNIANRAERLSASLGFVETKANDVESGLSRLIKGVAGGALIANGIIAIGQNLASLPGKVIALSDQWAGMNARMELVAGSGEKAREMNEAIYASAMKARAGYADMADGVSKLVLNAQDAFPTPEGAISFMETMQKMFVIGGTSAEAQKNAMLQLTQALGSGVLQGDEFRSIAENAPMLLNKVAEALGVSRGEVKKLAAEGQITADVIKKAVMGSAGEIDSAFSNIPKKWSDVSILLGNIATKTFGKISDKINELANTGLFDTMLTAGTGALILLSGLVENVVDSIMWLSNEIQYLGKVFSGNWGTIKAVATPVLAGLITAVTILGVRSLITAGSMALATGAALLHTIQSGFQTAAIIGLIFAQEGFNAALYACPLTWIVAAVALVIVAYFAAVEAINYFADTNISAVGLVAGLFAWLFAGIFNRFALFVNIVTAVANFFASVWRNPMAAVENLFVDIWNAISGHVEKAVRSIIDMIMTIPGMDKVIDGKPTVSFERLERKTIEGFTPFESMDYLDPSNEAAWGYNMGAGLGAGINGIGDKIADILNPKSKSLDADDEKMDRIADAAKGTQGNTGKMKDSMGELVDIVEYMRDIASREAINKYTTASINLNMGGISNSIYDTSTDLAGLVDQLTDVVQEAMVNGAKAVER